jgi:aminobenzoyl-glutamate utilization protein B
VKPLAVEVGELEKPLETPSMGGSSDDIGDVMWAVPTITIRYPSNVPSVNLHNVMAGMAMATPIAHKGAVAGAKAVALTTLDLLTTPRLVADAKAYQGDVQFAKGRYEPVLTQEDSPAIHLNDELMERMRPRMAPLYYDRSRYGSYLEQLGVDYGAFAK